MTYYLRTKYLPDALIGLVASIDWTPTTFYYGTVTTTRALTEAEMGDCLVLADADTRAFQAELAATHRAESF